MRQAQGFGSSPYARVISSVDVSAGLALLAIVAPIAGVARLLIRHHTERQRLALIERLAARHGIDAMSVLSKLIPPESSTDSRPAPRSRRLPTK
jgi:hypothetical protein